jgi:hypothetical protein
LMDHQYDCIFAIANIFALSKEMNRSQSVKQFRP